MENNNFLSTRIKPTKRIRNNKKVFGIVVNKNRNKAKTSLQQVLISLLKKEKKTSSILNTSILIKKTIILINVLKRITKSQIASFGLINFYAGDYS